MVDPVDFEDVQRFPHIFGWAFFPGMGKQMQAKLAGSFEDARKFGWRVADFAGIKPDTKYFIKIGFSIL